MEDLVRVEVVRLQRVLRRFLCYTVDLFLAVGLGRDELEGQVTRDGGPAGSL